MGGIGCCGSTSARQDTATECVECRCTTAPASGRCPYTERCRKDSLVCLSPESRLPFASTLDNVAGSSRPRQELVGVISQPSSVRTLILPELPAVRPRSNIDLPRRQISSLSFDSFIYYLLKPLNLTTKQLRSKSNLLWVFPRLVRLEHGIEDDEHFAHAGGDGHIMMLTRADQPLVERSDHGIATNPGDRGPIQGRTHRSAPAPDLSLSALVTRVSRKGGQARQGADFLAAQAAQLRQRDERAPRGVLADAREALEQISPRLIDGGGLEPLVDLLVQGSNAFFQEGNGGRDVFAHLGGTGRGQPVLLRHPHAHELRPAREQLRGHLALFTGQGTHRRLDALGKQREHLRIDRVGLGKLAQGPGKVAYLARIDHRSPYSRAGKGRCSQAPEHVGGFHDHQRGPGQTHQPLAQLGTARFIVGYAPRLALGQHMDIQMVLRHIDTYKNIKLTHGFTRSYLAIIQARAQATARIHAKRKAATRLRDGLNQYTIDLPLSRPQVHYAREQTQLTPTKNEHTRTRTAPPSLPPRERGL